MRIAQVSPLYESVPPKGYGGTERVVSYLTEELVRLGHDVTLFASGDSVTAAELVPICPKALRLGRNVDPLAHHMVMIEKLLQRLNDFDVVHFHIDYLHFPVSRRLGLPHVTTLHGRLDLEDLTCLYDEFTDMPVVSISNAQRRPLPQANFVRTVYHGLPLDLYEFTAKPDAYLAFIGRISPEKRVDRAIEIAKRLGLPLKIAAKIDRTDEEYFKEHVRHLFDHPLVEFVGEIGENQKSEFLGRARCLLFPIDWPEPFGLVMIESFACGTPVVAYRKGSVPEVIDEALTGFVVDDLDAAVAATARATELDRGAIRSTFERRFSVERMARDYLNLYSERIREYERRTGEQFKSRTAAA